MRRFFAFLVAALFLPPACMAANAAAVPQMDSSVKVADLAGILTDAEEARIAEEAVLAISATNMDIVILTINDGLGKTPKQYSEEFFESNNYGVGPEYDGLMLYIDMGGRDVYMAVSGRANVVFTLSVQDKVLDVVAESLSSGDYYGACLSFIDEVKGRLLAVSSAEIDARYKELEDRLDAAERGESGFTVWGAAGIAALVSGGGVLILFLLHSRSLSPKPGIQAYFDGDGVRMTRSDDIFLRTHTTRTAIPRDNSGGRPGGGTGGVSRSSGGRTFGGSGRKF